MKNWKAEMDAISETIRDVEHDLHETFHYAPADFETLSWRKCEKSRKMRIFFGDRPFIETPMQVRVEGVGLLPGLVKACDQAMKTLLKKS